jgi:segregation and condensation protein A
MKSLPERKPAKVEAKMHLISIEDKINELSDLLERMNFALFQGLYKKFETRYEMVVYTMAMLEMARWKS